MNEEWKDMQQMWAQSKPGAPDVGEVLRYVSEKSDKFDRGVKWRNLREWLGGLAGLAMIFYSFGHFQTVVELAFLCSMGVLLVAVCTHLWLTGRVGEAADPSLSREQYRAALEEKFARQARTIARAKHWFIIPVAVTGAATAWTYLFGSPGGDDWFYFPLILVGASLAWWANAVGVRTTQRDWEEIRRALDDGRIE